MNDRVSYLIANIERTLVAIAALAAFWPLAQYYAESGEREKDRKIREAQFIELCQGKIADAMRVAIQNKKRDPQIEGITKSCYKLNAFVEPVRKGYEYYLTLPLE